jgi:very-short-patch-repair endonuclease
MLVVELDDRSHRTPRGKLRVQFRDDVLRAAGMPIYRIRAAAEYNSEELATTIGRILAGAPHT